MTDIEILSAAPENADSPILPSVSDAASPELAPKDRDSHGLLDLVVELEAQFQQAQAAMSARVEALEAAQKTAAPRVEEAGNEASKQEAKRDVFRQAWLSAPLQLRLKFARELLPEDHALQAPLKEAASLEDLRRRGRDLETWLTGYPSLFADAVQTLDIAEAAGTDAAADLAMQTLTEARQTLETDLSALGLVWVAPASGDAITGELEVIGEEAAEAPAGTAARLRRRGFRIGGRLALPAQVIRAVSFAPAMPAAPEPLSEPTAEMFAVQAAVPAASEPPGAAPPAVPDWLRTLQQRVIGCDIAVVQSLAAQLAALTELPASTDDETLQAHIIPLLPLLGLRYAEGLSDVPAEWGQMFLDIREPLTIWLSAALNAQIVEAGRGEAFDAATMEAVETRRTAHAQEDNTVVKSERVGLRRGSRLLIPAHVVRYTLGGNP